MSNIVFFEVQPAEQEKYKNAFPEAILFPDALDMSTVTSETEIISCHVQTKIGEEEIQKLPNLKLIVTRTTGYDHIDILACKARGITVCNIPDYGSRTVAEFAFALLLALTRKLPQSIKQAQQCDFDHADIKGIDLFGKTIGFVGFGKIGREAAAIAHGFGMNILAHCRTPKETSLPIRFVDLNTLLSQSDVISLHVPYSPETHHLINQDSILRVKNGAYLINTARGGIVETEAIFKGLESGKLAGVGLDVYEEEQTLSDELSLFSGHHEGLKQDFKTVCMNHILMNHPKVIATPHNAFNTSDALARIVKTTIENVQKFEAGTPQNIIS